MTGENAKILSELLQGQRDYIGELKLQTEITRRVENDLTEIKESLKDHNKRLVEISKESTINTQSVIHLKEEVLNNKEAHEELKKKIKESKIEAISTAQKNVMIKIYAAMFGSLVAFIFAVIGMASKGAK